jgi:DNA or RNA helicases of superfamily II
MSTLKVYAPKAMRDYQLEALKAALKARRGIIVLPTGAGKTLVGSTLAVNAMLRGRRVAVLVPTKVLAEQWEAHFKKWWGLEVGVVHGERRETREITVWVYNSFVKTVAAARRPLADVIIVDEAHHAGARGLLAALRAHEGAKIIGLTATPARWDGEAELLAFMPVVFSMGPGAALVRRALVDFEVRPVPVSLAPREAAEYAELDYELRRVMAVLNEGGLSPEEAKALKDRAARLIQRRKLVAARSESKMRVAVDLLRRLALTHSRVLVFTEASDVAEKIAAAVGGAAILASTPRGKRERMLEAWGREFSVLVTCKVLEEGFDVPECDTGVILATGSNDRQLIQRVGRLLRPAPGKTRATVYFVYARGTHEEGAYWRLKRLFRTDDTKITSWL